MPMSLFQLLPPPSSGPEGQGLGVLAAWLGSASLGLMALLLFTLAWKGLHDGAPLPPEAREGGGRGRLAALGAALARTARRLAARPPAQGGAGTVQRSLAFAGAAALVLALARAWRALRGGPGPFELLAELLGLAAASLLLIRMPRWLAEPSTGETEAITRGEAADLRLQTLARDLEAQMTTRTAELQESEARLQGFIRHAAVAIAFKGLDGGLLLTNQRAEDLMSLWQAGKPVREPLELWPPEVAARLRKLDEQVLVTRETVQTEASVPLAAGGARDFLIQKFPLMDTVGHCWGIGIIATDITERKRAEQAHLQHQKLESIGLLAGGIAHDFNNLLGAMRGHLDLARLEPGVAEVRAHFDDLEELIGRASGLVAQILAYAGKGKAQVQALDLNAQVEGMTRLLRASLSRKAALRWDPAPGLPPMEGDPAQVQQVIMNLVLNASDALAARGGTITVRTGLEVLTQGGINGEFMGQGLRPGPHLTLEVADDGPGMAPGVKERIFDPFFTTKFAGRGLGLSAVQGILRSHQGGIRVTSAEGEGTAFKLVFPILAQVTPAPAALPPAPEPGFKGYRGWGAVLLVEDEEALRTTAAAALCRMGFTVLEAQDGVEALDLFKAERERIRLVLMDLTMPRMDGEAAFRELRRAGARVPVILTSGLGQDEVLAHFAGKGLAAFLPKPYRLQALMEAVRAALGDEDDTSARLPAAVVWTSAFETGHPLVDAQHARLVARFNDLLGRVVASGGAREAVEEPLHEFVGAAVAHFGSEEGLMADADYGGLEAHRAVHALLTAQIQELAQEFHRGAVALTPPIMNFLEGWLMCHIQYEDRRLAPFLKPTPGS